MSAPPIELVRRAAGNSPFEVVRFDGGELRPTLRLVLSLCTLRESAGGWLVTSLDRKVHLRLSAHEHALWCLLESSPTLEQLSAAAGPEAGSLAFVQKLRRAGVLTTEPSGFLRHRFAHVQGLRRELTWTGAQTAAERIWRGVRPLFTRWSVAPSVAIGCVGLASALTDARPDPSSVGGAWGWFLAGVVANRLVHEVAHAVAVVALGCRVGGVALGVGGLEVDLTDMVGASRPKHVAAALAGPATNLAVALLAAMVALTVPDGLLGPIRGVERAGFVCALTSAWPFWSDNDGAEALAAWLRIPMLRRASFEGLRSGHVLPAHGAYLAGCVVTAVLLPLGLAWALGG